VLGGDESRGLASCRGFVGAPEETGGEVSGGVAVVLGAMAEYTSRLVAAWRCSALVVARCWRSTTRKRIWRARRMR
jgi:hypothetical protein